MRGGLALHMVDIVFELARRHRKVGAYPVLFGVHFLLLERHRRVFAARQAHGALMHGGHERQHQQQRQKKSQSEKHHGLDRDEGRAHKHGVTRDYALDVT